MKIYSGDIKLLYISGLNNKTINNLSINEDALDIVLNDETILMKDAKFYYNWAGRLINIDTDNYIESRYDAEMLIRELGINSARYVDYNNLKLESDISKKEFKQLKKELHNKKA